MYGETVLTMTAVQRMIQGTLVTRGRHVMSGSKLFLFETTYHTGLCVFCVKVRFLALRWQRKLTTSCHRVVIVLHVYALVKLFVPPVERTVTFYYLGRVFCPMLRAVHRVHVFGQIALNLNFLLLFLIPGRFCLGINWSRRQSILFSWASALCSRFLYSFVEWLCCVGRSFDSLRLLSPGVWLIRSWQRFRFCPCS